MDYNYINNVNNIIRCLCFNIIKLGYFKNDKIEYIDNLTKNGENNIYYLNKFIKFSNSPNNKRA